MRTKEKNLFIPCSCLGEGILITHFEDEIDKEFYLAMFRSYNLNPSIKERIKYAWYHLRTGKKYNDQICMEYHQAGKLISFLKNQMDSK